MNGLEFLTAKRPKLWREIRDVIASVDASLYRTKKSLEVRKKGRVVYSPKELNDAFEDGFDKRDWKSETVRYFVCEDAGINRRIIDLPRADQRLVIEQAGFRAWPSHNQTDFVKQRVAVEVQLGKYAFVAYDLAVKHLAFYVHDLIDVGVEIIPMKALLDEMSSGPASFEAELFNLVRGGRGVPPVPLVLIGIDA